MVFELSDDIVFPDPRMGEEDGLLAIGGDLSDERLLLAYSYGIFPWFSFRDWPYPAWYCPMQRFVIFPDEIHISHSMHTLMNKDTYHVTFNEDFVGVIHGCSEVNGRYGQKGAWLGEDMIAAYTHMHRRGFAKSVEVWNRDEQLVGGLYGMAMGKCFIGESMFSREPNTSKLALIHLAQFMKYKGARLIDCQLETAHLKSMGGRFIPYKEYLDILHPGAFEALGELPEDRNFSSESPDEDLVQDEELSDTFTQNDSDAQL